MEFHSRWSSGQAGGIVFSLLKAMDLHMQIDFFIEMMYNYSCKHKLTKIWMPSTTDSLLSTGVFP